MLAGSDVPDLGHSTLAAALAVLDSHAMCLGPSTDGGFYLVGASPTSPLPLAVFDGVRWSTGTVYAETEANAARLGVNLAPRAHLPSLMDIDYKEDLEDWVSNRPVDTDTDPPLARLLQVTDKVLQGGL